MNGNIFGNFKKRDLLVVLIAIIALAGLFTVIRMTRRQDRIDQNELIQNSQESAEIVENVENTSSVSHIDRIAINEITSDGVIELYNNSTRAVSIAGNKVYVGTELAVTLPDDAKLDAKGFYVVETKKSMKEDGGTVIRLCDSEDSLIRAISVGAIQNGSSYGCIMDGSYETGFISSTVGTTNEGASRLDENGLVFSVPGGFYEDNVTLELTAPEGCKIYYTLDSTTPTTDSAEYTSKISIVRPSGSSYIYAASDGNGYTYVTNPPKSVDLGTVISAIAVDSKGKIVDSKTEAYFIGYNNDTDYVGLPVLTLEVDPDEMFGFESGIYVPGKSYYEGLIQKNRSRGNYLNGGTISAVGEYFESTKDKTFAGDFTVSIYNDERRGENQKAFALTLKSDLPVGTSLDTFLNNGSNRLLLLSGGWDSSSKIRNYFVNSLVDGTSIVTRDYSPCIVFINGEYWGLYTLTNEYTEKYLKNKLDIKDSMIVVAGDYGVPSEYTEFYDYVATTDFSVEENYQALKSMMDISNYIEFMCTNIFIGNTAMNRKYSACVFRTVNSDGSGYSDGRWRWALNNVDSSLCNTNSFLDPYTKGDYSTAIMNTYLSPGIRDDAFFNSLLQNDSFGKEFSNTMKKLMESNLNAQNATAILDQMEGVMSKAVLATTKRFAQNEVNHFVIDSGLIKSFFASREEFLNMYTEEYISKKGDVAGKITLGEEEETEGGEGNSGEDGETAEYEDAFYENANDG